MEVSLRRSWADSSSVRDDEEPDDQGTRLGFPHESLTVYKRSLQIHRFIRTHLDSSSAARPRCLARIDELSTSLTLNIAEGNGRFSRLDHRAFVKIAEEAGTKLAAYMDLAGATMELDAEPAKVHLREIMAMLAGLRGYLTS